MTAPIPVAPLLHHLRQGLQTLLKTLPQPQAMVAIQKGGTWLAERLYQDLQLEMPLGSLDISFYRDDFTHIGLHPQVKPSHLPFTVEGSHIILVDDVLYTGRTVRAALNELFDYGRPKQVILLVLVARDGRELPICADLVGSHLTVPAEMQLVVDNEQLLFQPRG
jgi:pyrimidine operon attenuation protein/uracil phosphoribosyltransferase